MTTVAMARTIQWRILAALQLEERPTSLPLRRHLEVTLGGRPLARNRSGLYIIDRAAGLEAHTTAFENPPPQPEPLSVTAEISIRDPLDHYLPRRLTVALPRDPDGDGAASLFRPLSAWIYPAPAAPTAPNWSLVRASLSRGGEPAAGAFLRLVDGEGSELASGYADRRGEALVAVPGVPITRFTDEEGDGDILTDTLAATLEASWHPGQTWPPDPDRLERDHGAAPFRASAPVTLKTGRQQHLEIELEAAGG